MIVKFSRPIIPIMHSIIRLKINNRKLHKQVMEQETMAAEPDLYINRGTSTPILPQLCLESLKGKVEKAQESKEKTQRSFETFSTQDKILKPNLVKSSRPKNERGSSEHQRSRNSITRESQLLRAMLVVRVTTKCYVPSARWVSKKMKN